MKTRAFKISFIILLILTLCTVFSAWTERMMTPEVQMIRAGLHADGRYTLPARAIHQQAQGAYAIALQPEEKGGSEKKYSTVFVALKDIQISTDEGVSFNCMYHLTEFVLSSSRELADGQLVYVQH